MPSACSLLAFAACGAFFSPSSAELLLSNFGLLKFPQCIMRAKTSRFVQKRASPVGLTRLHLPIPAHHFPSTSVCFPTSFWRVWAMFDDARALVAAVKLYVEYASGTAKGKKAVD